MAVPNLWVMARNEAFELVLQECADFAIRANLIERIALAIARRPHALDIGVPVDRITYDRKWTIARLHLEPLCAEGVTVLRQVSRDARQYFLVSANELHATFGYALCGSDEILRIERRKDPCLLFLGFHLMSSTDRVRPSEILIQLDI